MADEPSSVSTIRWAAAAPLRPPMVLLSGIDAPLSRARRG